MLVVLLLMLLAVLVLVAKKINASVGRWCGVIKHDRVNVVAPIDSSLSFKFSF